MPKRLAIGLIMAGLLWAALSFCSVTFAWSLEQAKNQETNNLNVLFIGFENERLEMVSVYSISYQDQMQSGAVFFPVHALLPGEELSLREYYQNHGVRSFKKAIEKSLGIKITYYVVIQNSIMEEVQAIIGPMVIGGEELELSRIFTTPPGSRDGILLGELVKRLRQPEVYFWRLPRLFLTAHRHLSTDFPLTAENLWLHYRIASRIPTDRLQKVILSVQLESADAKPAWHLSEQELQRVIYDLTR